LIEHKKKSLSSAQARMRGARSDRGIGLDGLMAASRALASAREDLAQALVDQIDQGIVNGLTGRTSVQATLRTLTASAQRPGYWQLTRFDQEGPAGDSQYPSARAAVEDLLREVDAASLQIR